MPIPLLQVDAFADRPFTGNPAAVCLLEAPAEAGWMQQVAEEMKLSETAFLHRDGDLWRLRWFTPAAEVDLCGHATLASAHTLWERGDADPDRPIRFETRSGMLTAERRDDLIWLDFPADPVEAAAAPDALREGLRVKPDFVGRSRFDYLVELRDAEAVRAIRPHWEALRALETRGVIVTAAAGGGEHDFVSRFFAPRLRVDEDPVTGSAHCVLAPFWAERLGLTRMTGYQASARGGTVHVEDRGERVGLGGTAVTVLRGELLA